MGSSLAKLAIAVAATAVPKYWTSKWTLEALLAVWSANEVFWVVSTQTWFVAAFQRTAKMPLEPAGLPSRLTSLPTSPPRFG